MTHSLSHERRRGRDHLRSGGRLEVVEEIHGRMAIDGSPSPGAEKFLEACARVKPGETVTWRFDFPAPIVVPVSSLRAELEGLVAQNGLEMSDVHLENHRSTLVVTWSSPAVGAES